MIDSQTVGDFAVQWSEAELGRVIRRVRETRLPPVPNGSHWDLGCSADFMIQLQRHWGYRYDAQAAIRDLNRFPQYLVEIEGERIHYVHVAGERPGRRPLILTHGWPGSHFEFWRVIEPLAFPSRHGGDPDDAFDVVVPSLPGFGFSGKPSRPIGQRATAGLWKRLMNEVLCFRWFLAQGGDYGAPVTTWLGADHADCVRSIHLNMLCLMQRDPPASEAEAAWLRRIRKIERTQLSYAQLQMYKPWSIAWVAADNPLGQAAWLVERFHDWTDLDGRAVQDVFPLDHLVTNAMIYVMTESIGSAALYYHARLLESRSLRGDYPRCRVPTAFAAFPGDPLTPIPPRSRAEPIYDIVQWTEMPRGGHFSALQEPDLFVADLRRWARVIGV